MPFALSTLPTAFAASSQSQKTKLFSSAAKRVEKKFDFCLCSTMGYIKNRCESLISERNRPAGHSLSRLNAPAHHSSISRISKAGRAQSKQGQSMQPAGLSHAICTARERTHAIMLARTQIEVMTSLQMTFPLQCNQLR